MIYSFLFCVFVFSHGIARVIGFAWHFMGDLLDCSFLRGIQYENPCFCPLFDSLGGHEAGNRGLSVDVP